MTRLALLLFFSLTLVAAPFYAEEDREALRAACTAPTAPLLTSDPAPVVREEAALGGVEALPAVQSATRTPSARDLIDGARPVLLRGTAVDNWPARRWTWESLESLLDEEDFADVVLTNGSVYAPVDVKAALEPLLRYPSAHETRNMSGREFFRAVEASRAQHERQAAATATDTGSESSTRRGWRRRLVHFGEVPRRMRAALEPQEWLYPHPDDAAARMQYVWLSTPGVRTHTHFDSDPNFFVQLIGRKRFVLWPPSQTEHLCLFPRLHPLWHKSRVDFEAPNFSTPPCETYNQSRALVAQVQPGDVLYLPPFWWHTVETLGDTPSFSLSTLSRWPQLYIHLNAIYAHTFFFDRLRRRDARLFALRAFIVQLLRRAAGGAARSEQPALRALRRQYTGLEGLFERGGADSARDLCVIDDRGTPTCRHCLGSINFDVSLAWDDHLRKLPEDVRSTVLTEFIEELTQHVIGTRQTLPFWETCFGEHPFFLTDPATAEHVEMWAEGDEEGGGEDQGADHHSSSR